MLCINIDVMFSVLFPDSLCWWLTYVCLLFFQYKLFGSKTQGRMLEIANHVDKVPFQGSHFVCLFVNGCMSIVRSMSFSELVQALVIGT